MSEYEIRPRVTPSQQTKMMERFGVPVNICGTNNRSVGHAFSGKSIKNSDKFESERI